MPAAETPDYQGIIDAIRAQIASGELQPGDQLPSRPELAKTHNVHLSTVARAITVLKALGVVRSRPGRGLYVADNPPKH
jgi:DNA-binding GntR family transcriptional regulator